jgi:hypothetical protein
MKNGGYDEGLIIKMPSAMFATLLLPFVATLFLNNRNERMEVALIYLLVLAISGWIFALFGSRIAGVVHSTLMLGIAGFCFYTWLGDVDTPLADNPAAGVIAIATVVCFIIGALAGLCGIGIAYLVFKKT